MWTYFWTKLDNVPIACLSTVTYYMFGLFFYLHLELLVLTFEKIVHRPYLLVLLTTALYLVLHHLAAWLKDFRLLLLLQGGVLTSANISRGRGGKLAGPCKSTCKPRRSAGVSFICTQFFPAHPVWFLWELQLNLWPLYATAVAAPSTVWKP